MRKTLTAAVLVAVLAACGDDEAAYPTTWRHVRLGPDLSVDIPGADIGDVCETIAARACATERCRLVFFAHCDPLGQVGRIEAGTVEEWDQRWEACLAATAGAPDPAYDGHAPIAACAPLAPLWR